MAVDATSVKERRGGPGRRGSLQKGEGGGLATSGSEKRDDGGHGEERNRDLRCSSSVTAERRTYNRIQSTPPTSGRPPATNRLKKTGLSVGPFQVPERTDSQSPGVAPATRRLAIRCSDSRNLSSAPLFIKQALLVSGPVTDVVRCTLYVSRRCQSSDASSMPGPADTCVPCTHSGGVSLGLRGD